MLERYLDSLMPMAQAQDLVLANVRPLEVETVPLLNALGRTLAEDARADLDVPPFVCSGVDGYAVIADDTTGATSDRPVYLKSLGEVPAGSVAGRALEHGTAMRIMTGAALPDGADAVVMVEDTRVDDNGSVAILEEIRPHRNYRASGEDVRRDEIVVEAGTCIRPAELAMLAAVGQAQVGVYRQPRVAIIATGDELVDVNEVPPPGKIRDSNSYSMIGQVIKYGGMIHSVHRAVDTIEHLEQVLEQCAPSADLLLTSGGVSVGDYDLVKDVMLRRGEIVFWGLAIKPGRPLAFGRFGPTFFFGLPGYPVSGMVTFEQFVRLALLRMQGRRHLNKPVVPARLSRKYKASPGKVDFLRVNLVRRDGEYWADLAGVQGSGRLSSMVRANALMVIPEDVVEVNEGDIFDAQLVDAPEIS